MKKLFLFLLLCTICFPVHAGIYVDNVYRFQLTIPDQWKLTDGKEQIDKGALFELSAQKEDAEEKVLFGLKAKEAVESRADFSFSNITEAEKKRLLDDTLGKIVEHLPLNASIQSQNFTNYGYTTYIVTTINYQAEEGLYRSILAMTYHDNIHYTLYLFVNANNLAAIEEFNELLRTFQLF